MHETVHLYQHLKYPHWSDILLLTKSAVSVGIYCLLPFLCWVTFQPNHHSTGPHQTACIGFYWISSKIACLPPCNVSFTFSMVYKNCNTFLNCMFNVRGISELWCFEQYFWNISFKNFSSFADPERMTLCIILMKWIMRLHLMRYVFQSLISYFACPLVFFKGTHYA